MANIPIIAVLSNGDVKPEEIITNIRKIPIEQDKEVLDDEAGSIGYKYNLVTKYYTTDLMFCPLKCPLELCPEHLLNFVEGVLIYFDANNRNFIDDISKHAKFLETNQIEFGILLCNELSEEKSDGITYKEAKQYSTLLDVIELGRKREEGDDDDDSHDPIGYDELIQAIKSFLWSNVNVNGASRDLKGYVNLGADDLDLNEIVSEIKAAQSSTAAAIDELGNTEDEEKIEAELAGFEKLLNDVMQFKSNTASWSRDETLNYAQGFAEMFDKLIGATGENIDSPDDSGEEDEQKPQKQ